MSQQSEVVGAVTFPISAEIVLRRLDGFVDLCSVGVFGVAKYFTEEGYRACKTEVCGIFGEDAERSRIDTQ